MLKRAVKILQGFLFSVTLIGVLVYIWGFAQIVWMQAVVPPASDRFLVGGMTTAIAGFLFILIAPESK